MASPKPTEFVFWYHSKPASQSQERDGQAIVEMTTISLAQMSSKFQID
jgi:hypothetical protein